MVWESQVSLRKFTIRRKEEKERKNERQNAWKTECMKERIKERQNARKNKWKTE